MMTGNAGDTGCCGMHGETRQTRRKLDHAITAGAFVIRRHGYVRIDLDTKPA